MRTRRTPTGAGVRPVFNNNFKLPPKARSGAKDERNRELRPKTSSVLPHVPPEKPSRPRLSTSLTRPSDRSSATDDVCVNIDWNPRWISNPSRVVAPNRTVPSKRTRFEPFQPSSAGSMPIRKRFVSVGVVSKIAFRTSATEKRTLPANLTD